MAGLFDLLMGTITGNPPPASADDAVSLNQFGTGFKAGEQIAGGLSHIQYGQTAMQAEIFKATQLRIDAGQVVAASQRAAADIGRQTDYVASRALAVAGASGGGASDPGVITQIANIAKEGAYKQAVALFGGQDRARSLRLQADASEYQGKETAANSDVVGAMQGFRAVSTLMKGSAVDQSLYQRFGGGGPKEPG